jgi:hypothetical protein
LGGVEMVGGLYDWWNDGDEGDGVVEMTVGLYDRNRVGTVG